MVTSEQIQQCKMALVKRQGELIQYVQGELGLPVSSKESTGELSSYDNHPADTGTELFERGRDAALNEHTEKELEDINEALHSIEEGTYGICATCGGDIPYERLSALPTTDRCMNHASNNMFMEGRPIEEEVYSANLNPHTGIDKEQTGYDAEDAWQEVSKYGTSDTPSDFYEDKEDYNEMYPNSDEDIGAVEDLEGTLAADIEGNFIGLTSKESNYE